ncbi:putative nucleotidyltransferase substrate binding domain protein [compost metagenome]
MLEAVGYPPCDGKVISSNPDWCMSLAEWNGRLVDWFKEPSWEAVRYLLIIADGRCISGKKQLLVKLKDMFFTDMLNHPVIVQRMLENTLRHKMLLGIFGQFLKEQYGEDAGSLDIKYGAYIPMVNSIRLLSVQACIRETSTLGRLRELVRCGVLSETDGLAYEEAFLFILKLRLMATEDRSEGYYGNNGKLSSGKLTKEMSEELKRSLRLGKKLQRAVYKRTMGRLS